MHTIQRKIMLKLLYAESLGYAQMRPEGVESNHYAYHLEQLVKNKLVVKHDKRYSLDIAGLAFVDRMSQAKMVDRLQPHICTAIGITTADGQSLLYKRTFQPFINRIGFVMGKIHYDETLQQAAERELLEKSGITGVALTHRGVAYLDSKIGDATVSKVMYHLFSGTIDAPVPTPSNHRGSCLWADSSSYKKSQLMPGFLEMKKLLDTQTQEFFAELSGQL